MQPDIVESISKMTAEGNRLNLPADKVFSNYGAVKKALVKAGGKYKKVGKVCGFEFPTDASALQTRLVGGEEVNDKKKYQFFATPASLAKEMVDTAQITSKSRVLEPSAGLGALANLVRPIAKECVVVELMPTNAAGLRDQGYDVFNRDFLDLTPKELGYFDQIIANPPFTKNQDIDHILYMYSFLKEGGILISLSSKSWLTGSQKKQRAFREWLEETEASIREVSPGVFKDSGTNVGASLIIIER